MSKSLDSKLIMDEEAIDADQAPDETHTASSEAKENAQPQSPDAIAEFLERLFLSDYGESDPLFGQTRSTIPMKRRFSGVSPSTNNPHAAESGRSIPNPPVFKTFQTESGYDSDNDRVLFASNWPIPFPRPILERILKLLPPKDLENFALSAKASFVAAAPLLYYSVSLPIADPIRRGIVKEIRDQIDDVTEIATVDLSSPALENIFFPGESEIRKSLRKFKYLKHLVILKTGPQASLGVLTTVMRYILEQTTLDKITLDLDCGYEGSSKFFTRMVHAAWDTALKKSAHNNHILERLEITLKNLDPTDMGLGNPAGFLHYLVHDVHGLTLDISGVNLHGSSAGAPSNTDPEIFKKRTKDLLRPLATPPMRRYMRPVKKLDITFSHTFERPYFWIASCWPLETLKVTFSEHSERPIVELTDLRWLKKLTHLSLPWMYDHVFSRVQPGSVSDPSNHNGGPDAIEPTHDELEYSLGKFTPIAATKWGLPHLQSIHWKYTRPCGHGRKEFVLGFTRWGEKLATDASPKNEDD
ncbi:hypothetical protein ABW21_db0203388 [Orbilia brochopaga]|nr:hypothetical protein ABW21_db0203388 [Drechslerella brochopaga]